MLVRAVGAVEVVVEEGVVVHGWRVLRPPEGVALAPGGLCGVSLGPGMNIRSWFQRPLMTAVDGLALSGLAFSGEAVDSEADDGTGGDAARAAPSRASTPACHIVSGVYWLADMDAWMAARSGGGKIWGVAEI